MQRDTKLENLQTQNNLAEQEKDVLKKQLESAGPGDISEHLIKGDDELARVAQQNALLKEQVEALTHVEAKLVAKNQNHKAKSKSWLWLQVPEKNESIPEADEDAEDGIRKSTEEINARKELEDIQESDDEEAKNVEKIEGAHIVRLNAEKDDNLQLKRRLSQVQNLVRRNSLRPGADDPASRAALAASLEALSANNNDSVASLGLLGEDAPDISE